MSSTNNKNDEWKKRELGALWKQSNSNGNQYYSGTIKGSGDETIKIVCFPNKFKDESSNQPDIRIYTSQDPS